MEKPENQYSLDSIMDETKQLTAQKTGAATKQRASSASSVTAEQKKSEQKTNDVQKKSARPALTPPAAKDTKKLSGGKKREKGKKGKRKVPVKLIAVLLVLVVIGIVVSRACSGMTGMQGAFGMAYVDAPVVRQDLVVAITGTGTVTPNEKYSVNARVKGDIVSAKFEEGDVVKKGDLLFEIDAKDIEPTIQQAEDNVIKAEDALKSARQGVTNAQLNLRSSQKAYDDLLKDKDKQDRDIVRDTTIASTVSGQVTKVHVEVGDMITAGTPVMDVRDNAVMVLKVPFHSSDAGLISVGSYATVTLTSTGETLSGTVDSVSAVETVGSGGSLVREVKIRVNNPGGLIESTYASAQVGAYTCQSNGTFEYNANKSVIAKYSGEVSRIHTAEGGYITNGQTIITLKEPNSKVDYDKQIYNADIAVQQARLALVNAQDAVKSAQDNIRIAKDGVKTAKDALDDYRITAPIDGTVIEKNYKAGDLFDPTSTDKKAMAVIFDMSSLSFTMNVDELDVTQLKIGQKVDVTADAVENQSFTGIIDNININGVTTNGVTTYPVSIKLKKTADLLPGMNVSAKMVVEEMKDVLTIPAEAVSRGNTVLIPKPSAPGNPEDDVPAGYERITIEVGGSDGTNVEVISGLKEGDMISYMPVNTDNMYGGGIMIG